MATWPMRAAATIRRTSASAGFASLMIRVRIAHWTSTWVDRPTMDLAHDPGIVWLS
jgi:hypothetical protein